jgi:hypothetical protein
VRSVHTLAGEGDLGKLIGKLVRPIGGSVVVPITENAVSVTITAQVLDDRKFRNQPGSGPDGPANCYPTDYPARLPGLLLVGFSR